MNLEERLKKCQEASEALEKRMRKKFKQKEPKP